MFSRKIHEIFQFHKILNKLTVLIEEMVVKITSQRRKVLIENTCKHYYLIESHRNKFFATFSISMEPSLSVNCLKDFSSIIPSLSANILQDFLGEIDLGNFMSPSAN